MNRRRLFDRTIAGLVILFAALVIYNEAKGQGWSLGDDGSVYYDMPYGTEITRPGEGSTYIYKTPYGVQIEEPRGVDRYPNHIYDGQPSVTDPYEAYDQIYNFGYR